MTDEQKRAAVAKMKQAMQYGEVEYEAGLDIRKISGWYGVLDLAPGGGPGASLFGPQQQTRSSAIGVVVCGDIETPLHDQEFTTIPFGRVLQMRTAPRMP